MSTRIYVDVGHGGVDPGAVYRDFIEKELNLKVALYLRDFLSNYDCELILNRTTDVHVPDRTKKMIAANPDGIISIHHNAGEGDGCEAWIGYNAPRSEILAEYWISEAEIAGQNSRGVKTGIDFWCIAAARSLNVPSFLGEFAFIDSQDRMIIDTEGELEVEAACYGQALVDLYRLPYKGVKAIVPIPNRLFRVQTGAFAIKANADAMVQRLQNSGFSAISKLYPDKLYRVQTGAFNNKTNADAMRLKLTQAEFPSYIALE